MLKLLPVAISSNHLTEICQLLTRFGGLIFSEFENPVSVFLSGLETRKIVPIAAFLDDRFIGFVAFYDFQKISKDKFSCYMYGAAKRGVAKEIELVFDYLFKDLKKHGCAVLRCETREYNLPMRKLANRLGFEKKCVLNRTSFFNGEYKSSILYEKLL